MKMLSDKQIRVYLRYSKSKNKRLINKAKSRLTKDYKRFVGERIKFMREKYKEITGMDYQE